MGAFKRLILVIEGTEDENDLDINDQPHIW